MLAGKVGLMPSKKDGSCIHLNKNNQCDIYEERPYICRVNEIFKKEYKDMNYKEFCIKTNKECNKLMDMLNIDKSLRIDENVYDK